VLAATILGSSMAFIDSTVVNVALPALQSTLHATITDVQWVVESYGLLLSALILVGGALGDSLGRRRIFLLGVIVFGVASAGCGLSATVQDLVIWRAVQGLSAAFLVPGSLAIISASFDEKSRGKAIGTWSGFTAITMALGPVLGGWLVEHASWHWIFFINLPLAVAVVLITLWYVPESRNPTARRVDWLGAAAATFGLAALVYGFLQAAVAGWTPGVVGTLISDLLSMALFVLIEKRVSAPMVPLNLFRSSSFTGANLLTLFLYAALGAFLFLYPMNLIQIQKYPAVKTGAASLPMIFLVFLLSRWSGGLVARYGPKIPLVVGPSTMAAGFALFAMRSVSASYWTGPFPGFVVLGLGLAITVAPLTTVVMGSVEQARAGAASGINNAVARVAGVLAVAVLGIVMVAAFASSLKTSLSSLHLDSSVALNLQSNVARLGAIDIPRQLDPQTSGNVRDAVIRAFLFGFRIVMSICTGLAVASAAVAWRMIRAASA
jgi:EmrB/QacA subfamily drug resistance transporter